MAGFECATGTNSKREWIDQVAATEHDRNLLADYRRMAKNNLRVAREGVRWPIVDRLNGYRFESLESTLDASEECGIQLILDLFHYGYPEDIDIFSPSFVERFRNYCGEVAMRVKKRTDGVVHFTPVNEPSFFAWAGGDAEKFRPHASGRSFELKVQLARAAIQGINEILKILPGARFVNVDPICRVALPTDRPDLSDEVRHFNENVVFQSWDMLAGKIFPELGGSERHLDIVGLNYYWTNQWEHQSPDTVLRRNDSRSWPLRDLIRWVWYRYRHEMIISETAHLGRERAAWIRSTTREAEAVLNEGIPLRGVCLYPVLGMPEWHDQGQWARMGLWDLELTSNGLKRNPHRSSFKALAEAQSRLEGLNLENEILAPTFQTGYLS